MGHSVGAERIIQHCLTILLRSGDPPALVARRFVAEKWHTMSEEERKELATTGLSHAVADASKSTRGQRMKEEIVGDRPDPPQIKKSIKKIETVVRSVVLDEAAKLLDSIVLQGADGQMLSLLRFGLADLEKWNEEATTQELAWSKRCRWFGEARSYLQHECCKTIADLPERKLVTLAEEAKSVWK